MDMKKQIQSLKLHVSSYQRLYGNSGSKHHPKGIKDYQDLAQSYSSMILQPEASSSNKRFSFLKSGLAAHQFHDNDQSDEFDCTSSSCPSSPPKKRNGVVAGIGVIPEPRPFSPQLNQQAELPLGLQHEQLHGSAASAVESTPTSRHHLNNASFNFSRKSNAYNLPTCVTNSSPAFRMIPLDERISTMPSMGMEAEKRPRKSWKTFLGRIKK